MPPAIHCGRCCHPRGSGRVPSVGEVYTRLLVCRGEGGSPTYASHPGPLPAFPRSPAHSPEVLAAILAESVQVKLELGHKATLRTKPTKEGFTHDWIVYVRGPEGSNIQHFVEKVVFYLHESFPKPKRTIKEPPYQVGESGYGGFTLPIEIHFKNKEEPRKIRFEYDLFLHLENCPPVNHIRCEKLTFKNPTEEFRRKLIKAGGVGIPGPNETPATPRDAHSGNGATMPTPENKTFSDLFGTPFKADTAAKKPKPGSKEKPSATVSSGKPASMSAAMLSSGSSTPSSVTQAGRDKTPSSTPSSLPSLPREKPAKRLSESSPPPPAKSKKKKKDKDRDREKDRDRREEKSKHKKHKKKDKRESRDPEPPAREASPVERPAERPSQALKSPAQALKSPAQALKSPAQAMVSGKAIPEPAKPRGSLRPFEEEVLSTGEASDFEDMAGPDVTDAVSNASSHSFSSLRQSAGSKPLTALYQTMLGSDASLSDEDEDILSPLRASPPALFQQSQPPPHNHNSQIPVLEREKTEKPAAKAGKKERTPRRSKSEKRAKDSHREKESKERKEQEMSEKENKVDNENEDEDSGVEHGGHAGAEGPHPGAWPGTEERAPNGEYLVALLQLQRSLMTLTDRTLLQDVVQIIKDTGLFKISDATFDFDLCLLDAKTVRRLNELISNACST